MKIFFSIMLIFLFLSCGGGKKTPESAVPDEDGEQDIDIVDDDEFTPDANEDTEIISDPCETEPCKGVENSTGECVSFETRYVCECADGYVWQGIDRGCIDRKIFSGAVCTGQTKCYDMEKEIPCPKEGEPFYGQDAQYAEMGKCLPRSYTVKKYDDGETVIDNNTGLEWERRSSSSVKGNGSRKMEEYCNKRKELGGFWDWRIPPAKELFLIVDSSEFEPAIDNDYFPETPLKFSYSGQFFEPAGLHYEETYLEGVDFKDGSYSQIQFTGSIPEDYNNVRCVRGETKIFGCNNYLISGDGYKIYNDIRNGLVLQTEGSSGKNWQEALEYCENLNFAGISDWRLPNKNEILSPEPDDYFWTSTTLASNPADAWKKYSSYYLFTTPKSSRLNVLCVASNPCADGHFWTGEKCVGFSDLFLKDDGCACLDGYEWNGSICEKVCDDTLCKDIEHSTGLCLRELSSGTPICQCDEYYRWDLNDIICENPCEENPCENLKGSDGSCTLLDSGSYACGCAEGYYNKIGSRTVCLSIESCGGQDCFNCFKMPPCKNSFAKIMWALPAEHFMNWKRADQYCEDLEDFGYTNWRLPSIDELRTLEMICDKVKSGGQCSASEKNNCLTAACLENCKCSDLSDEAYLQQYDFVWSSSVRSDNDNLVLGWNSGFIGSFLFDDSANVQGQVWCVRDLE